MRPAAAQISQAIVEARLRNVRGLIDGEAEEMTRIMIAIVRGSLQTGVLSEVPTIRDRIRAYEVLMSRAYGAPKQIVETTRIQQPDPLAAVELEYSELERIERTLTEIMESAPPKTL